MTILKTVTGIKSQHMILGIILVIIFNLSSCGSNSSSIENEKVSASLPAQTIANQSTADKLSAVKVLVLPENPYPGQPFRIIASSETNFHKTKILISGPSGTSEPSNSRMGEEMPFWKLYEFEGIPAGKYKVTLTRDKKSIVDLDFTIAPGKIPANSGLVWKTRSSWDGEMENLYSAWINALFMGRDEQTSWKALHEVTQDKDQNFLHNYLSMGEDDPDSKNTVIMRPDCADNPFYLRAYFAWKLGLPFGYHMCDRGSLERKPKAGQWVTNEISTSKTNQVLAFNSFMRMVMNGVQSATARTGLDDENSDYYPVPLEADALRPGTVYADPYGHTLVLVGTVPQTSNRPGTLLSVDAQPDGTVGIKRFWKGNFLFNTSGVIGEAGFKAFRPIGLTKGVPRLIKNKELTTESGFVPYSLEQRKMETAVFYNKMERIINPQPLDAEDALLNLIQALHEQLLVRVTSVANGEEYFRSHPGAVIPMPSTAPAVFQTGGQWEDFSTPNRDLRLLIAIDAVMEFPGLVSRSPGDFKVSERSSPEQIRAKLQTLLDKKTSDLTISYIRSDGKEQELTIAEILERRDALEMAYNPNDGIEIRWGEPENSKERASCKRHAPASQLEKMKSVRKWFDKRLHPPT